MLVPTVVAIVTDENHRENRHCFTKRPVLLMNLIVSSIIPRFTTTLRSMRPYSSNLHNSFEERRVVSVPVRLETFALRGEARAGREEMFISFYANLAKTVWIRAVEIVIKPVTAKTTEFDSQPSEELYSIQVVNVKHRSFWSSY